MAKTFDSIKHNKNEKDAFIVERDDGSVFEFTPSKEGLYYYNFMRSIERKKKLLETKNTMMIDIENLQRRFTKREVDAAEKARRLYVILAWPSEESFEHMIKKGKIINNPVTVTDFINVKRMYGKDLGVIKGKTVREKTNNVKIEIGEGPEEKRFILLSVDIMHLIGIYYLVTSYSGKRHSIHNRHSHVELKKENSIKCASICHECI